ncbi:MAG: nitroreductase family protein [Clostridiaceae bacterium]|nr:nitroreductase family protein [Clostridiaceae bacterium]
MNDTISLLIKRRSIRRYLAEQIDDESLQLIIKTGLFAPNGGNHQYTRFLVVQNETKRQELRAIVRQEFAKREIIDGQYQNSAIIKAKNQESYDFMFHAPTLIIAVAPRTHGNSMADSASALENMQLAATALGLGACWVNQLHWLTDNQSIRNYLEPLGLKEDEDIFGSIVVGYPDQPIHEPAPRKEGRVIIIK